jgi:hypothetical protein
LFFLWRLLMLCFNWKWECQTVICMNNTLIRHIQGRNHIFFRNFQRKRTWTELILLGSCILRICLKILVRHWSNLYYTPAQRFVLCKYLGTKVQTGYNFSKHVCSFVLSREMFKCYQLTIFRNIYRYVFCSAYVLMYFAFKIVG